MNDSPIDWSRNKTPQPRAPSAANHGAVSSSDDVEEAMATAAGEKQREKWTVIGEQCAVHISSYLGFVYL